MAKQEAQTLKQMIKNKIVIFFLIFLLFFTKISVANISIIASVDGEIITSYDIKKESDYLKILNPNLSQLDNDQIISLGRENNIPDGSLDSFLENALEAILEFMEENGKPNRLYTHAWEGGNRDHDAANILSVAIAKRFGILTDLYQFSLYLSDGLPFIFYKFFSPLLSNGEVISYKIPWKKRLIYFSYMLSYRSQLIPIIGLFPFYFYHFIFSI